MQKNHIYRSLQTKWIWYTHNYKLTLRLRITINRSDDEGIMNKTFFAQFDELYMFLGWNNFSVLLFPKSQLDQLEKTI